MLYVYIVCLVFGIGYSAVSALLGAHDFDHGGVDHGGLDHGGLGHADLDPGSFDHAAGADGFDAVDAADSPSPFNPLVIASAITAFGAVGLIGKAGFSWSDLMSAVIALGFAGLVGTVLFFGIVKFMYNSQSNSVFSIEELVGMEAEVITPVPENGLGEIAYVINGIRYNYSAKSMGNTAITRGKKVIIREIAGNYAVVQERVTISDLSGYETNDEKYEKKKINN